MDARKSKKTSNNSTGASNLSALQAEWYAKLAQTGFEDAEYTNGSLKRYHSYDFRRIARDPSPQQLLGPQYYEHVAHLLHTQPFDSTEHKTVWELHSQGMYIREIAAKMSFGRTKVHHILKEYQRRFGLEKSWKWTK